MFSTETVAKIAYYLKVSPGKITTNEDEVVTISNKGKQISGFTSILCSMMRDSKSEVALNSCKNHEIEAQVNQWIEYGIMYVAAESKDKQFVLNLMKDMDTYLLNRSYLVHQYLTLADLVVFYAINDIMKSLNPIEKEKYLNLSRWFDHLQKLENICLEENLVNFAVLHLHGWASGTHL